jgi:hypothetical protein
MGTLAWYDGRGFGPLKIPLRCALVVIFGVILEDVRTSPPSTSAALTQVWYTDPASDPQISGTDTS